MDGNGKPVGEDLRRQAARFLYKEADLLDNWQLEEWLQLFTDDCRYWVPGVSDDYDPEADASIIYDNRMALEDRAMRVLNPAVHCQSPRSRLRRVISNIRCHSEAEELRVFSNFIICEARLNRERVIGGSCEHTLRITADGWRIRMKKVLLANNDGPLSSITIIL